jgi:hypothetical protein
MFLRKKNNNMEKKLKIKKNPITYLPRWYNQQFPRWVFENQPLFITTGYYKTKNCVL